jgi:hypothetical protein
MKTAIEDYENRSNEPMLPPEHEKLYQKYEVNANDSTEKSLVDKIYRIVEQCYIRVANSNKTGVIPEYELGIASQLILYEAEKRGYTYTDKEWQKNCDILQFTMRKLIKYCLKGEKSYVKMIEFNRKLAYELYMYSISK